jgi:hypothetical protein
MDMESPLTSTSEIETSTAVRDQGLGTRRICRIVITPSKSRWVWKNTLTTGAKRFQLFREVQIGNSATQTFYYYVSSGVWDTFWVNNTDNQGTYFRFFVDYGSGTVQLGTQADANFTYGEPMGENGRWGTGSGGLDHKDTLTFLKQDRTWTNWGGNFETTSLVSGIPGFYYETPPISNTEYRVCKNNGVCG